MADLRLVAAPAEIKEAVPSLPIRVVLAENHRAMRDGVRLLLDAEEGIQVIGEAEHLEAALRLTDGEQPHVLVLALAMISGSARETIGKLRARAPAMQVVILTMDESPVVAQHLLACGALGLVLKDRADDELATAVHAAARGEQYISSMIAERLDMALRRSRPEE